MLISTKCFGQNVYSSDFKYITGQNGLSITELRTFVNILESYPIVLNFNSIEISILSKGEVISRRESFNKVDRDELNSDYLKDTYCKTLLEANNILIKHFKHVKFNLAQFDSLSRHNLDIDNIRNFCLSNGINVEILNTRFLI